VNKVIDSPDAAIADLRDGMTVMLGGFGLCGIPENLIAAAIRKGLKGLHTISCNMGVDGFGLGLMLEAEMIASHIGSYVGENRLLEKLVFSGDLNLTLIPQGTMAERIRAGGAGIPAFYVPAGAGTIVAEGKEVREFDGKPHLMESALRADVSLIKAWKADRHGNLVYRETARNFNPVMATAAELTIAEVEELVEPGQLDADQIVTPGIYVDRIVVGPEFKKPIESRFMKEYVQR
jgi:3-oxoacid CoA-transferase subunit A